MRLVESSLLLFVLRRQLVLKGACEEAARESNSEGVSGNSNNGEARGSEADAGEGLWEGPSDVLEESDVFALPDHLESVNADAVAGEGEPEVLLFEEIAGSAATDPHSDAAADAAGAAIAVAQEAEAPQGHLLEEKEDHGHHLRHEQREHELRMVEAEESLKAQLERGSRQMHGLRYDINWLKSAVKDLDMASESISHPHPSQSLLDRLTKQTESLESRIEEYIAGNATEFRSQLAGTAALRLLPLRQDYVSAAYQAASLAADFRKVTEDLRKMGMQVNVIAGEHLDKLRLWSADQGTKFQEALREAQPRLVERFEQQKRQEQTRVNFAVLEEIRIRAAADDALEEIKTRGSAFADLSGCCEGYTATEVAELLLHELHKLNKTRKRIIPIFVVTEPENVEVQEPPRTFQLQPVHWRKAAGKAGKEVKRGQNEAARPDLRATVVEFKRVARQITDELLGSKVPMLARILPHSAGESVLARAATIRAEWALKDSRERFSNLPAQLWGAPRRSILPPLQLLQDLVASSGHALTRTTPINGTSSPFFLLSVDGPLIDAVQISAAGASPVAVQYPQLNIPIGPLVLHASYALALSKSFSFILRTSGAPLDVPAAYTFPPPFPSACAQKGAGNFFRGREIHVKRLRHDSNQQPLQQQGLDEQLAQATCVAEGRCSPQTLPALPKDYSPFKGCLRSHLDQRKRRGGTADATAADGPPSSVSFLGTDGPRKTERPHAEANLGPPEARNDDRPFLELLESAPDPDSVQKKATPAEARGEAAAAVAAAGATAASADVDAPGSASGISLRNLQAAEEDLMPPGGTAGAQEVEGGASLLPLLHAELLQEQFEDFRKAVEQQKPVAEEPHLYSIEDEEDEHFQAGSPAVLGTTPGGAGRAPMEGHEQNNAGSEENEAVLVAYLGSRPSGNPLADGDGSPGAVLRRHKLLNQSRAHLLERLSKRPMAMDSQQGEFGLRTLLLSLKQEDRLQALEVWAQSYTERHLEAMGVQLRVAFGESPLLLLPLSPFFTRSMILIRIHTSPCKGGHMAVPSTEALFLSFLAAAYPGSERAAVSSCRKLLKGLHGLNNSSSAAATAEPTQETGKSSQTQQQLMAEQPPGTTADSLEEAHEAQLKHQQSERSLTGTPQQQKPRKEQKGQLPSHQPQQPDPLIPMVKAWAYHGGMSSSSSSVVHLMVRKRSSEVYIQTGAGGPPLLYSLFQEAGRANREGVLPIDSFCLTDRGIFAGSIEHAERCSSAKDLVGSVATRLQAQVIPALFQRPLRGRTILVTVDQREANDHLGEGFLAVELVAKSEARRQQETHEG
ncbi:hypothetical protein cyc_03044 [Cyclospora cayetanensis]|uniref:Uncharacterized protein n=1 Tax=Cyclospora cayetanensis TaxID=88456 RepID=A0A1D3D770_9EIME|nr:hypothetical protein cyc_03044 [Cyclospora cayetanensis]